MESSRNFRDLLAKPDSKMFKFDLALALLVSVLLVISSLTACSDPTGPKVQSKQSLTYLVTASFDSPRQYGLGQNWMLTLGNGIDTTSNKDFLYILTGESLDNNSPTTMVLAPGKTAQLLFYSNDGAIAIPMGGNVGVTYSLFADWPVAGTSGVQLGGMNIVLSKQDQQYANGAWSQVQYANHVFSLSGNRGAASINFPRDPSRADVAYGTVIRSISCNGDGTAHLSGASMIYTISGPFSFSTSNSVPPVTIKCTGYESAASANAALQAIKAHLVQH